MSLILSRRNALLAAFIAEGTWYLGMHTVAFNSAGAGGTEVAAAEYARQEVTFGAPVNAVASNTNVVSFPEITETGGWGTIVQFGLYSDPNPVTAPNPQALFLIPSGSFSTPPGVVREFPPGYLTMEERPTEL